MARHKITTTDDLVSTLMGGTFKKRQTAAVELGRREPALARQVLDGVVATRPKDAEQLRTLRRLAGFDDDIDAWSTSADFDVEGVPPEALVRLCERVGDRLTNADGMTTLVLDKLRLGLRHDPGFRDPGNAYGLDSEPTAAVEAARRTLRLRVITAASAPQELRDAVAVALLDRDDDNASAVFAAGDVLSPAIRWRAAFIARLVLPAELLRSLATQIVGSRDARQAFWPPALRLLPDDDAVELAQRTAASDPRALSSFVGHPPVQPTLLQHLAALDAEDVCRVLSSVPSDEDRGRLLQTQWSRPEVQAAVLAGRGRRCAAEIDLVTTTPDLPWLAAFTFVDGHRDGETVRLQWLGDVVVDPLHPDRSGAIEVVRRRGIAAVNGILEKLLDATTWDGRLAGLCNFCASDGDLRLRPALLRARDRSANATMLPEIDGALASIQRRWGAV